MGKLEEGDPATSGALHSYMGKELNSHKPTPTEDSSRNFKNLKLSLEWDPIN